ncbi:permease [Bradyrhizobium sp. AUGA SZCCT0240]|jgi:ABC-2 type transport system permease protein|uniref:permease n=1 Tax=unclassified Bradyrhizobium TaxID=2631580 RepID=UPI001BAD60F5|nr:MULTISPECIES: permease [unclassified Bradyrhizobium]MBR1200717.1 permease [Bradyrhizobium sp. AUGA SZCCT0158]MBR1242252.1 permease [Bradyrhizobium sp. AUGA SZCCT0274]MBR1256892.1 permease [Bradyrhizobium sp. AUGA SZCCT0240]
MSSAADLTWFARHEIRLAWREWLAMMTGARRKRTRAVIGLLVLAAFLHLPAYAVIGRFADLQAPLDKPTLIVMSATIFLAWALMLSQAIESVTRVFYARADLDLIMSSPVRLTNIFSVRIAAIALSVTAMALLLSSPFVDVLVIGGGIRWFSAFGVVIAIGLSAAAVAIAITVLLFRLIGPSRTRLAAQILAAVIGAGFVIALQVAAILSYGTLSRFTVLTSDAAAAYAPDFDSPLWWPARAAIGDGEMLSLLLAGSLVLLGGVMAVFSPKFAGTVVSAAATATTTRRGSRTTSFRRGSRQAALRWKEFMLLRRDPWLVSQSLMQLLYLVPPALMLWRSFSDSSAATVLITPVIVMAAGQLAGGLAWLTISGEDAADLVATAPMPPGSVIRAKVEVVMIAIGVIFAPLVAALALASPVQAAVTAIFVVIATVSAAAIQLWFRVQAKRSQFRRRQTSSRIATFAEAFCSIGWAATAILAVTIPIAALISGAMTALMLAGTWKISPRRD